MVLKEPHRVGVNSVDNDKPRGDQVSIAVAPRRLPTIAALALCVLLSGAAGYLVSPHTHRVASAASRTPVLPPLTNPNTVSGVGANARPAPIHILWVYHHGRWRAVPE